MIGDTGNMFGQMGFAVAEQKYDRLIKRSFVSARPISISCIQRGFTLLELMIVMFIMVLLVTVALPMYQRSILHAKEAVLKENLYTMRKLIDQYAADKGKLPQSLKDLEDSKYLREVPVDPMTDENTWNEVIGEDPNSTDGGQGLVEVHSLSEDISSGDEGKPYSQW